MLLFSKVAISNSCGCVTSFWIISGDMGGISVMLHVLPRMLEMLTSAGGSSLVTIILGGSSIAACAAEESVRVCAADDRESRLLLADLAAEKTLSVIFDFFGFCLIGVEVGVPCVEEAGVRIALRFPPETETEIVVGSSGGNWISARSASSRRLSSSDAKTEAFLSMMSLRSSSPEDTDECLGLSSIS